MYNQLIIYFVLWMKLSIIVSIFKIANIWDELVITDEFDFLQ